MKMLKLAALVLCGLLLTAGCETSQQSDSHYDEVSQEIERLKAQQAATLGDNIKVTVDLLTVSAADSFTIDSLFQYVNKNVTIAKQPSLLTQSGLQIGVAGENFRARLDIARETAKSSEQTELFLVLADGATGFINIGTEIAVPRFYYYGRWYSGTEYQFRQAGRSLQVTVRKLPSGLIDMELTPVFSSFLNSGGDLELTELSTRVTARPGQTLVIGGGDTSQQNVATALLGYSRMGVDRKTLITVTPFTQQSP